MAGPFVVDASVILNAFNPKEAGSETSQNLLRLLQERGMPVIAPTLLLVEAAATISRGQNNPELARQFAETLPRLPNLMLVPLDQSLAMQAVEVASYHRLRGSDAVYAAVAQRFACPLITLDREQHERAASLLKTYFPAEVLSAME